MAIAVGNVQSLSDSGYGFTIKATNEPLGSGAEL